MTVVTQEQKGKAIDETGHDLVDELIAQIRELSDADLRLLVQIVKRLTRPSGLPGRLVVDAAAKAAFAREDLAEIATTIAEVHEEPDDHAKEVTFD